VIAVVVRVEYRIASLAQLCNDPGIVEPVFRRAVAFGKVMSEIDQNFRPGGPDFGDAPANLVDAAVDGDSHNSFTVICGLYFCVLTIICLLQFS